MSKSRTLSTIVSDGGAFSDGQLTAQDIGGQTAGSIATLTDVDVTTPPTDGQALVYFSSINKWKPDDVAVIANTNTVSTAATVGYALIFGG